MAQPRNSSMWGFNVQREPLRAGVAGVERTRQRMVQLISEGSKEPAVIDEARRAVLHVRPHDYHGEIQAVWDYLTGLTAAPYRLDPVDAELLQGAAVPSAGRDCDCMVIKAGSLFEAIGHPVEVVIAARRKPPPGMAPRYGHTWLRVFCRACRRWHDFDPVLDLLAPGERAQLGQSLPHEVVRRFRVSALGYTEARGQEWEEGLGLQGMDGFSLKKLAKGVATVGKVAAKAATSKVGGALIKNALTFVPGGQAALTAINVASKGVQLAKAVKSGGVKGLVKAAAPLVLDRLAPGAGTVLTAVTSKVPSGVLTAASGFVKQTSPKLARQASQVVRAVRAAAPAAARTTSKPAPAAVRAVASPTAAMAARLLPNAVRAVAKVAAKPAGAPLAQVAAMAQQAAAAASSPPAPLPIFESAPLEEAPSEAPQEFIDEQVEEPQEPSEEESEVAPGADPFEETSDVEGEL